MSLFNTSAQINTTGVLSNTIGPISSIPTTIVNQASSALECQLESAAFTIGNAASSIVSNAINTAETVAGSLVTTAIDSAVGGVANLTNAVISNAANSVTGLLSQEASVIANNVSSVVGNLFSNTLAAIGTDVRIPIPDPIASSFANGVPQSGLFATNSILAQMQPVTLGALNNNGGLLGSVLSLTNLPALLVRYGVSTVEGLSAAVNNELQQLALSAGYSPLLGLGAASGLGMGVMGGMNGCACPTANYAGYGDFAQLASPISTALTGSSTGLAAFYNPYLSDTVDINGNAISGIPSTISASTVNQITNTLTQTLGVPGISVAPVAYAAQQSLFDGLYAIAAKLELVAVMQQMAASPKLFGPSTQAQARTLLMQTTNNASLIAALLSASGAQTVNLPMSWIRTVVSNPNLTTTDISTVSNILTSINITATEVFSTQDNTLLNNGVQRTLNPNNVVQSGAGSGGLTGNGIITDAVPIAGDGGPTLGIGTDIWTSGWTTADGIGNTTTTLTLNGTNTTTNNSTITNPTNRIIWNSSVLSATQKPITTALLSSSPLTSQGAQANNLPTTGLPSASNLATMARGIPRSLTGNGRFVPLTSSNSNMILFGNILSIA